MTAMIKEVAKRAGVSTATVSRILNGKGGHSAGTVKSVEKVIEELGFGASNRTASPECVGIVMLSCLNLIADDYSIAMLSGVMSALTAEGVIAQIIPITPGRMSFNYIKSIVETYGLKGLLIQEFDQLYSISSQLNKLDIPVVCIGNAGDKAAECSVCSDDYSAAKDAAAYFWSLGHRRFGLLSMRQTDITQKIRVNAFCDFINEKKCGCSIWQKEYNSCDDSVSAAVAEITNLSERPTAILSTNSAIALKFMIELKQSGIRIPEELSLISFEERGELEHLETPITAICQPTRLLGEEAVKTLIKQIRHYPSAPGRPLNCNLVVRGTTAAVC